MSANDAPALDLAYHFRRDRELDTTETGWTEGDTVAHCGGDMGGDFIWTMTSARDLQRWTELRGV